MKIYLLLTVKIGSVLYLLKIAQLSYLYMPASTTIWPMLSTEDSTNTKYKLE